jgi:hypothetical protein
VGEHGRCIAGGIYFPDRWVYFAMILNWDAAEQNDPRTVALTSVRRERRSNWFRTASEISPPADKSSDRSSMPCGPADNLREQR